MEKTCVRCGSVGTEADYYRRTGGGWFNVCKVCAKASAVAWQRSNPAKVRENCAKWRLENPERVRQLWRKKMARRRSVPRVWYRGIFCGPPVPEWMKKTVKRSERFAGPPKPSVEWLVDRFRFGLYVVLCAVIFERKEKRREFERARERRYGKGHRRKSKVEFLFRAQSGLCVVCHESLRGGFDVDHITPKAAGGGNEITNLQLLCKPCNNAKSDRHPVEFMRARGYLL